MTLRRAAWAGPPPGLARDGQAQTADWQRTKGAKFSSLSKPRHHDVSAYYRMAEAGILRQSDRVELMGRAL